MTPTISCHALVGINTPQTLNIEGYIKKKKVIMLIDSGSTHNFIHCKLAKALNCFIYPTLEFQVMIANGETINFSGKFHKINITMGEYDPGGYWWPPTYSTWTPTIASFSFSVSA
jgi:hypothetical protein